MRRTLPLLLGCTLAGAASVFAFAPYRLFWLMPLLLAAMLWLSTRLPRRAFLGGWLWGLAAYTANFYWIYISLHDVAGLPAPAAAAATLLLPAYLALFPGVVVHLTLRLSSRPWVRALLLFPALWTLGEWLRSWMLTGFPWGAIGYSQITESPLAAYAPVTGVHGVSYAVALSAGALLRLAQRPRWPQALLIAGLAALWGGGHALRGVEWTQPEGKPVTVALSQGNIPQTLKWDPAANEMTMQRYYRQIATTRADLMILPETAFPLFLDDLPSGVLTMIGRHVQGKDMALAVGIPRRTDDGRGYLNAVVALSSPGLPYYAKNHLVPFGEFIPFPGLIGWIYQYMNMPLSGFSRGGANQEPLLLAGHKVAFNVCYEDSFGEELIASASRATILANVSNLAWFGHSNAMSQHLQLSQARALELGRPMLRATNTGMTAIIRADGEIASVAAPNTLQVLEGRVEGRTGLTPYMRSGNLPVLLWSAALLLVGVVLHWRRR